MEMEQAATRTIVALPGTRPHQSHANPVSAALPLPAFTSPSSTPRSTTASSPPKAKPSPPASLLSTSTPSPTASRQMMITHAQLPLIYRDIVASLRSKTAPLLRQLLISLISKKNDVDEDSRSVAAACCSAASFGLCDNGWDHVFRYRRGGGGWNSRNRPPHNQRLQLLVLFMHPQPHSTSSAAFWR
ncbi:hypothetical protein M0R45_029072 [Rubus argutus]|uniref:Uncharacterized protein n=1 Tax=Rubus argutus TaxID=59490 RepID=A0AAW1W7Z1_RUBAR